MTNFRNKVNKRTLIFSIMNRQLILMGPIKRKDGLDYLILTGQIEVKRTKRKQRISYLAGLSEAGFGSNC